MAFMSPWCVLGSVLDICPVLCRSPTRSGMLRLHMTHSLSWSRACPLPSWAEPTIPGCESNYPSWWQWSLFICALEAESAESSVSPMPECVSFSQSHSKICYLITATVKFTVTSSHYFPSSSLPTPSSGSHVAAWSTVMAERECLQNGTPNMGKLLWWLRKCLLLHDVEPSFVMFNMITLLLRNRDFWAWKNVFDNSMKCLR